MGTLCAEKSSTLGREEVVCGRVRQDCTCGGVCSFALGGPPSAPVKQQSKESRKSISKKVHVIQVGRLDSKQTGYDIKLAMQLKDTFPSCVCNVQY